MHAPGVQVALRYSCARASALLCALEIACWPPSSQRSACVRWQVHEVKVDAGGAFVSCAKVMDLKGHKSQACAGAVLAIRMLILRACAPMNATTACKDVPEPKAGTKRVSCFALCLPCGEPGIVNNYLRQSHGLSDLLRPVLRSMHGPVRCRRWLSRRTARRL